MSLENWVAAERATTVADQIHHFEGPGSNWVVATEGRDFTLIDCGYPADLANVEKSISHLDLSWSDCTAILVTHAHVDHVGPLQLLSSTYGIPVLCSDQEADVLRGVVASQVTLDDVLALQGDPLVSVWMHDAIQAGGLTKVSLEPTGVFHNHDRLDLPGSPRVIMTPGHTPGHAAFNLQDGMAIATGDAWVTGHAISSESGPQMLHEIFQGDNAAAGLAFKHLQDLEAAAWLPGHGAPKY
ncbi:Glyoxylase, beta-lactamase superfamily II [Arthrobacter alpinus]|uniref:Glyoxylase, beta-lactamase superfamily II n=1 Tax=Arthrobacter alpinus TaxID=656366 RepID=A0A1H5PK58_9MICC|nr:Glyoxylase, beta-lactamase superfamily II [Arthrobacter alpinus]SEF13461.1 Glyoxylase, beta-lactamase superfamily II [Arthrobacter alpinus]SEF13535.1 Glyoxylase, beta-lactamase superfamily II [Arthrobacter alpinus]